MTFCLSLCLLLPRQINPLGPFDAVLGFVPECIRVPRRPQEDSSYFVMLQTNSIKIDVQLTRNSVVISRNLAVYLDILQSLFSIPLSFHLKANGIFSFGRVFFVGGRGLGTKHFLAPELSKPESRIKWLHK